jgi:hypothetical protein
MSLDKANTVDAAGIENETGLAVLTIADSWDWDDVAGHLIALQNKLNAYFDFIDSGEVFDSYPAARGRRIAIDIVSRFDFPAAARDFLATASRAAGELNVLLRQRRFVSSSAVDES